MAATKRRRPVIGRPASSAANLPDSERGDLDCRLARIEGHVAAIRRTLAAGDLKLEPYRPFFLSATGLILADALYATYRTTPTAGCAPGCNRRRGQGGTLRM